MRINEDVRFLGVLGSPLVDHAGFTFGREVYSKSIGLSVEREEPM